jgi:hypothetical protein
VTTTAAAFTWPATGGLYTVLAASVMQVLSGAFAIIPARASGFSGAVQVRAHAAP